MMRKKDVIRIDKDWHPDRDSKDPIYWQIVAYFNKKILSGDWGSGYYLPSQRKMADDFGVNRSTIVVAMDELRAQGLIESNYGNGTRITGDKWALLLGAKTPDWQTYVKGSTFHPNVPTLKIINHMEFEDGIIRMSTGELSPNLMQSKSLSRILYEVSASENRLKLNYPEPLGMYELRLCLRERLRNIGIDVPVSCILVLSGALQALQLIAEGLAQPKSEVYMESPSYLGMLNIFQSVGTKLHGLPMDEKGIVPKLFKGISLHEQNALLYTIPTFQNPTCTVMPTERRQELLHFCNDINVPIIEDDVFRELWLDEMPPPPIKSFDKNGRVIYISSLSKSFSPGLRLGWLVGPELVVQRLADIKMQMDYGVSVLTQQIAVELLKSNSYDSGMEVIREKLRERRGFMLELLNEYFSDIADWNNPTGGFFIWVRLREGRSADKLFEMALREHLLILPGSVFDSRYSSYIRLTFGYLSKSETRFGIKRLAELIREM